GNSIADFVAHSCKLVVEVDGESHDFDERLRHDEQRDRWFASRGYRVLRFTNGDVMRNLEGVALAILQAAEQAAPPSLTLPRKGRGNEPYINHLAEVANLLSAATDGADAELVAAGWLHDTIEDTGTTRAELAQGFSERVASLVVECTDDMSLAKAERRRLQIVNASHKS